MCFILVASRSFCIVVLLCFVLSCSQRVDAHGEREGRRRGSPGASPGRAAGAAAPNPEARPPLLPPLRSPHREARTGTHSKLRAPNCGGHNLYNSTALARNIRVSVSSPSFLHLVLQTYLVLTLLYTFCINRLLASRRFCSSLRALSSSSSTAFASSSDFFSPPRWRSSRASTPASARTRAATRCRCGRSSRSIRAAAKTLAWKPGTLHYSPTTAQSHHNATRVNSHVSQISLMYASNSSSLLLFTGCAGSTLCAAAAAHAR